MNDFIIAQIFGILGMLMNVISYQGKKQKHIFIMQFFGSLLFAINMYMLQAYTGAILNTIGIIRAITYVNKNKIKSIKIVNAIFIVIYLLSYLATFVLFDKAVTLANLLLEILPVVAMIATTISFSLPTSASIRKFAFISSPAWLIYNCFNLAIGGIICEIFSLISIVTAMIRLDMRKDDGHDNTNA